MEMQKKFKFSLAFSQNIVNIIYSLNFKGKTMDWSVKYFLYILQCKSYF